MTKNQHTSAHAYTAYQGPDYTAGYAYRRSRVWPWLFAGAAVLLLAGHVVAGPQFDRFQQAALDRMAPVLAAIEAPTRHIHTQLERFRALANIKDENEALKAENEKLKSWYQAALMLQSENEALRDLLNANRHEAQSFTTVRVLADSTSTYARSLLIEGGRPTGILKGQGVLTEDGLIGRVMESGNRTARILLLQDVNSRVPVVIEGLDIKAILAGNNTDRPTLDHISTEASLNGGERVITSGLGGLFPFGIPVGQTIKREDGTIEVELYARPEQSQFVQVVDYGLRPLISDPAISSAAASGAADMVEPN